MKTTQVGFLMMALLLFGVGNAPGPVYGIVSNFYITAGGTSGPIPDGDGLVQRLDGDGSNLTTLVTLGPDSRPRGITVDALNSHLYWNDWGTGLTQRSDSDGSNLQTIVDHQRVGLNDIDVDPVGGKLYVAMSVSFEDFHGVKRYNLDGSGEEIIWDALADPFGNGESGWFVDGIGLDPTNGHVYFGDPGVLAGPSHGVIRTDLDGSSPVSLVPHLDGRGRGMAVDPVDGKMYFAQHTAVGSGAGTIWSANLDGTGLTPIVTGLERPRDVALDRVDDRIYWVDEFTGLLQGANVDGTNLQTLASGLLAPDSLTITVVPEPAGGLLVGFGLLAISFSGRRRTRK